MRRLLPLVLLLAGCGSSDVLSGYLGRRCTVGVRPDALGMSSNLPASVGTTSLNGATLVAQGTLTALDDHWLTLQDKDGDTVLVARSAVLTVNVHP